MPDVRKVVTPKSLTLEYATLKLFTRVVLVTVNGAVPVAMLDVSVDATTELEAFKLPTFALPLSVRILPEKSYTKLASPATTPELLY